ncbi:MAG: GDP-mannose 4,6-dehydratase, partial [Candidatus Omnitrophica bacterium]|nr:GDP-mannose 4,6-dehydratase [Candidatus Omnitrophota bacterium]
GDISDSKKLQEAIIKHNCGYVMNFAASIEVGESRTNPAKYFYNNTVNTINLIQVAAETGIRYFIHSSTAAVYGEPESVPIDETAPLNANNAYGESKLLIERSMECYEEKYGMHFVRFRYFNVAGASLDGSCGEFHRPKESHIIPRLIFITYGWLTKFKITAFQVEDEKQKALYEGNSEIQDTTPIRDYINVLDLADLHELGCVYLSNGGASGAFNAGTGEGSSLKQVADAVRKFSGKQLPVAIQPSGREGEPTRLIASSNKAKEFLGWSPSRTLNDSVESLVKWYNSPLFKSMQANKNEPPVDEDVKKRADFAMSVIKALAANKVVSEDFKFELLYRMLVDTVEAAILRKDAQKGTELFTLSNRLVNMSRCIFTECAAISAAEGNNEIRRTSSLIRERVRGNNEIVSLVKSIIALTEAVEEKVIYAALISNLDLAVDFVSGVVLLKKPGDFNKAQASWSVPVLNREMLATRRGRSIQKMWGNFIRAVFSGMGFDALIFTVKVADLISNIEAIESYRGIYYHADTPVFFVVERDGKYEDNFSGVVNIAKHLPERMKESGLDYENFRGLLVHLAGQGKRNKPLTNTEGRGKKHFMSRASGDEYLARTLIESYQLFDEHTPGIIERNNDQILCVDNEDLFSGRHAYITAGDRTLPGDFDLNNAALWVADGGEVRRGLEKPVVPFDQTKEKFLRGYSDSQGRVAASWSVILHRPASLKALREFATRLSESGEPLHEKYALKVNSHIVTAATQTADKWAELKEVYDRSNRIPMQDWQKIRKAACQFINSIDGIGFADLGLERIVIDTGVNKDYAAYFQAVLTDKYLQALDGVKADANNNIIINCSPEVERELSARHNVYARNVKVKKPHIAYRSVVVNVEADSIWVATESMMADVLEETAETVRAEKGQIVTDLFTQGNRKVRIVYSLTRNPEGKPGKEADAAGHTYTEAEYERRQFGDQEISFAQMNEAQDVRATLGFQKGCSVAVNSSSAHQGKPDPAKPREGFTPEDVVAEATEIISSGKINSFEAWGLDHPVVKEALRYYEATSQNDKADRLRDIIKAGHLRAGPLTTAFGANVLGYILIATNENPDPAAVVIHENNDQTHDKNEEAERRLIEFMARANFETSFSFIGKHTFEKHWRVNQHIIAALEEGKGYLLKGAAAGWKNGKEEAKNRMAYLIGLIDPDYSVDLAAGL